MAHVAFRERGGPGDPIAELAPHAPESAPISRPFVIRYLNVFLLDTPNTVLSCAPRQSPKVTSRETAAVAVEKQRSLYAGLSKSGPAAAVEDEIADIGRLADH